MRVIDPKVDMAVDLRVIFRNSNPLFLHLIVYHNTNLNYSSVGY
jgi:hypothetical protein